MKKKKVKPVIPQAEEIKVKSFFDMVAPSVVKFFPDHFICGNTYRCVWALREYPTSTDEQAILRHLGEKNGVTLRIYTRQVSPTEEKRIIHNATNKNKMDRSNTNDLQQVVTAESNLQDVTNLIATMHRNREPLLHCAVFIELAASDFEALKLLQTDVLTELVRSKLNVDKLWLRQQQGFVSSNPAGHNAFGQQFERVLPASSVANLYPFNYSGKTDPRGFYIGKDKYGSNVMVDFDQRDEDKTSANILILGNSGQGKSYLMKLLILNFLEAGKSVITLDVEHEQREMCDAVEGCFVDLMAGIYHINVLEPKCWDDGSDSDDAGAPEPFRKSTRLAQHVSFLKDFFRAYKDFNDGHIDTIEIMVSKLYTKWGISDNSNFSRKRPEDYPILSDLYDLIEGEYKNYDASKHLLYTEKMLQEILLGLHSMCKGADSQFFNGHTNITSSRFLVFGVKGLIDAAKNVRDAMLFNILSYMSDKLLTVGNTVAALDELYIWLNNPTAIEYIRNSLKRVRKKESAMMLASQNLEDFDQEGVREMTKPLFSIPPHQFLFNAGSIDKKSYMDMLQLEDAEYNLIKFPQRGVCLYKCGNERYLLEVHAPSYKEKLFGTAGGR
ncbi:MAG: VirB4 family type IV secretion system protein [Prevotella sp.]